MSSNLRRVLATTAMALLALVALPAAHATAHAVFVSATPQPDARLRTPPTSVRMVFSEPLNAAVSGIDVYASSGRRVPAHSSAVDPGNRRAYQVSVPQLAPDRYAVVWHTVSAIDGHSRGGSYSFTVDRPDGSAPRVANHLPPVARAQLQVPTAGQGAATWFALTGLFLLTGAVLVGMLAAGTGLLEIASVRRRLWRAVVTGAACLVAGTAGQLISAWAPAGWSAASIGAILSSSAGRWWELRFAAAAFLLAGWRWSAERRWPDYLRVAAAALAAYSFAVTSHGAAAAHPDAGLGFEFAHVLAVSVWLGGAVAVAAVWAAARRAGGGDRRTLLRRYSVIAGTAIPVVIASGLANAVLEVGRIGDLTSSSYGRSLSIKLAVVVALLAVAAVNAALLRPALEAGRPRGRGLDRTVAIEAGLGLAVLVPTALLAVLAPSRPSDAAQSAATRLQAADDPARAFTGSTQLGGRAAEVTVAPAAVGVNAIRAEVAGRFAATGLRISVSGPGRPRTAELTRSGYDHDSGTHTMYQGLLQLDRDGTWQAVLQQADGPGSTAPIVMPVTGPVAASVPDSDDLAPWLTLIALAGGAAALGAATRGIPARRVKVAARVLGAGAAVAAIAGAGTLAIGASGQPAPAPGWGQARTVSPDATADARVWALPAGAGPMMPAIAPDGSVWIAEMNVNNLARLDPRHNVVREFHFPGDYRETMGVAVAKDGRVWLAQERAMALGMFDPGTGRYREFAIPGGISAPVGIALGSDGAIWFTEMSGDKIGRFDPSTATFAQYPVPTPDAAPYWLAVGPDGRVWFTEFATGKIGVLNPRSGRIREYVVPAHPNLPAVAVARDGTVWVTSTQGTLYRLTPSTGALRASALPAAGDYGVAVAPDGELWVGRNGGRTLFAVQPDTGRVRGRLLPAGSAPWWPTVDTRGHVWVALAGAGGNGLAEVDG